MVVIVGFSLQCIINKEEKIDPGIQYNGNTLVLLYMVIVSNREKQATDLKI